MARKQRKTTTKTTASIGETVRSRLAGIKRIAKEREPWLPWIAGSLYLVWMAYFTFRYHPIGNFGVETDFFAELVIQARKIMEGGFSPLNYGLKGPVYSLLLAGMYLVVREYFFAGLVLNLLASFVFLVTLYHLVRKVFNPLTAFITIIAVGLNFSFQFYTYQAGSDLPFMALCILSMYFLFRSGRWRDVAISALFGILAFLTRYNGAFIAMGSVAYLALCGASLRERLKRIGLWVGVFLLAGMPWFVPNYLATGNPVHNDNYINVMLEFYGLEHDGSIRDDWRDNLPKEFSGLGDIVLYNPVYFARHLAENVVSHFVKDIRLLVRWRMGLFVVIGLFFLPFNPSRRRFAYYLFGILYFLILSVVFYNDRFSLLLLAVYLPLAIWPYTGKKTFGRVHVLGRLLLIALVLVTATFAFTTTVEIFQSAKINEMILQGYKEMGIALAKVEQDRSQKLMARKPHVSYYAGLYPIMFPELDTVDELVSYCRDNGIRYVLYSPVEYRSRPQLRHLFDPGYRHPMLQGVFSNETGIIFRVSGV